MQGKRFKEEQIIGILQEAECGLTVAEVCRKHNCSEQSFYRWKAKFGGMTVSEVKRLRELERENSELKQIVADPALDIRMLKDINSRKFCVPDSVTGDAKQWFREHHRSEYNVNNSDAH